ncbi:MAG: methyltransferase dimerization domain-containing protein, partial [Gammaproteobacteria bacterium]|nr:methyltransferase dimerization domain-containing protein [Gammaproteobacteria bacterium]
MSENNWELPEGMDPMRVMQVASGYWNSCVLHAANRLNVFNLLDGQSKDLDTLTKETGADKRCLGTLLSALVSMDFLDRDGDVFMNNQFGQTFLTQSSKF